MKRIWENLPTFASSFIEYQQFSISEDSILINGEGLPVDGAVKKKEIKRATKTPHAVAQGPKFCVAINSCEPIS